MESGYGWRTSELRSKPKPNHRPAPEEIPDADHELVIERVCAIDVAKASGKVCVRVGSSAGRRVSKVWDVAATSGAVGELTDYLVDERIEKVTVESTSDYWRIGYYLPEAAGLDVQLVNARDVKNVPGRPKTPRVRRRPRLLRQLVAAWDRARSSRSGPALRVCVPRPRCHPGQNDCLSRGR